MLYLILILIIAGLLCVIFLMHNGHIKTLDRIDLMLTSAAEGKFSESEFSESRLSRTESKMYRYLCAESRALSEISSERNAIKTLISDISHQTKTPIANIVLYSDLLCDSCGMDSGATKLAQSVKAQADKLSFLIGALIKLSRLESGIVTPCPKENSVSELLKGLDFKSSAEKKGIDLKIETDVEMTALFDLKWTVEAAANIVDNAIKYTPEGGSVSVTASEYEMFVRIDVFDSGIGISEEESPKIFSRFYRSERAADSDGVGIGLYLAREIIAKQGGYIKVESEVNKGSVFTVFIPKKENVSEV